jgi:hypothetical protein
LIVELKYLVFIIDNNVLWKFVEPRQLRLVIAALSWFIFEWL